MRATTDDDTLHLLLAGADHLRPTLEGGLPHEATRSAPKPRRGPRAGAPMREAPDADPNDLPNQRWGLIAPAGREGDQLLDAIAPLIRLREEEQGAPAHVYRVEAGMDAATSARWRDDVHRADAVPDDERPKYLLLLGDLHQVSIDLQQALMTGAYAGRLHIGDASGKASPDGYAAYAEKVVTWSRRAAADAADALFYTARDGTAATSLGHAQLVKPCLDAARAWKEAGRFEAASIVEVEGSGGGELLEAAAGPRSGVLLSVSHGLGAPRGGWASAERRRALQGALVLPREGLLDAEAVRGGPFLPGGMWFCVACFGAGTPSTSAYHAWLSLLAREGAYTGRLAGLLSSLPASGERPFVAAMPQAALANPEGPLAFLGHIDLAWNHSFTSARTLGEGRPSRVLSTLKALVRGSRAGVALDALMRFYRETHDALMAGYEAQEEASLRGRPDPTDAGERGRLWMLRNDLRGYVLLGDPAARLCLRRNGGVTRRR